MNQGQVLNIASLAKAQKVAPAAIYGHFPGKLTEICTEMVRAALKDVARPFIPHENWEDYLRALFRNVVLTFKGRQNLAAFVADELSLDYYLNPMLVERVLFALHSAGLSEEARAKALDLVMGVLIGFLTMDRPGLKSVSSSKWIEAQAQLLNGLPIGEFPETVGLKQQLIKVAVLRSAQIEAKQPSFDRAHRFANCLITGLKAAISDSSNAESSS